MTDLNCKRCKHVFSNKKMLDMHTQYVHNVDAGMPKCKHKKCKKMPLYSNKSVCAAHRKEVSMTKFMTLGECKKYDNKIKGTIAVDKFVKRNVDDLDILL